MGQCMHRVMILAAALAVTAASAQGQDADVAAGHAFAREACNSCHVVDAEEHAPRQIVIGPAFRDIANTGGITATALRVFLNDGAPKNAEPYPYAGRYG